MLRSSSQVSISEETPTWLSSSAPSARGEAGEHRGDLPALEEIDQPHQHRLGLSSAVHADEVGDRVDDDHVGLEIVDQLVHRDQVLLQPEAVGPRARGTAASPS